MEQLQFPIGRFSPKPNYTSEELNQLTILMEATPTSFKNLASNLTDGDLRKTYRDGSWNVRQLVHHVADIHLLNFLRMKKTITEDHTEVTTIRIDDWAFLPDSVNAPLDGSLTMLEGINQRFIYLIKSLNEGQLNKSYYHPIRQMRITMQQMVYMVVWHMEHHQAHIELALGLQPHTFNFK